MNLTEYIILFLLVATTGAGIPGPGDAAMIAAGTLAGEGRLNIGVVVVTSSRAGCSVRWPDTLSACAADERFSTTRDDCSFSVRSAQSAVAVLSVEQADSRRLTLSRWLGLA